MNTVRKKAPNPVDQHVGSRVRVRRMMLVILTISTSVPLPSADFD